MVSNSRVIWCVRYPALARHVVVTLVSSGSSILNAFDGVLQERAIESLRSRGVRLLLNSSVVEVDNEKLTLRRKGSDSIEQLPQGILRPSLLSLH